MHKEPAPGNMLTCKTFHNGEAELRQFLSDNPGYMVKKAYLHEEDRIDTVGKIFEVNGQDQGGDVWLINNAANLYFDLDNELMWWNPAG